jgi:hypothetical protein
MTMISRFPRRILDGVFLVAMAGCAAAPMDSALTPSAFLPTDNAIPSNTPSAAATDIRAVTSTIQPTPDPGEWKNLLVIPITGPETEEIYRTGLALGNNPGAFSKIGDCESTPAWFLGAFDKGPNDYRLGEYSNLAEVIAEFQGSFSRKSVAARNGFNAASVFSPLWADSKECKPEEGPLACEYRLQHPIFAFIMLGSNDYGNPLAFEPNLRRIIEFSIQNGVVPILSTKADNLEGDESINAVIARLAQEYGVPLWNFWAAVQLLPNHGLQKDKVHLTFALPFFDDPLKMKKAWPIRNLTALQTLDSLWRGVRNLDRYISNQSDFSAEDSSP